MSIQTHDPHVTTPAEHTVARTHRPPGVAAGVAAWIIYWGSMVGLAIDALFAVTVVNKAFLIEETLSIIVVSVIGLIAAKLTTSAAIHWNSGRRVLAVLSLIAPIVVGVMLAWTRTIYGVTVGTELGFDTSADLGLAQHDEAPATGLMLGLYCCSVIGVFGAALKLFLPARTQLKHHRKEIRRTLRRLIPMEADLAAIEERLVNGAQRSSEQEQAHLKALEQLDAREAQLKAYARDAIARAVNNPAATPLVRAPHQPQADEQRHRPHLME